MRKYEFMTFNPRRSKVEIQRTVERKFGVKLVGSTFKINDVDENKDVKAVCEYLDKKAKEIKWERKISFDQFKEGEDKKETLRRLVSRLEDVVQNPFNYYNDLHTMIYMAMVYHLNEENVVDDEMKII